MASLPGDSVLQVTRSCAVPLHELEWRFVASGGPGGQHANRSNTKVELTFDVEFPEAGIYKLWVQVQRRGKVTAVPFVVRIGS